MKICTKCGEEKLSKEFYKNLRLKSGLASSCIECERAQVVSRHEENNRLRRIRRDNPEYKLNEAVRLYGLTALEFYVLLEEQNQVCKICGQGETNRQKKRLSVDHDHKTNIVRGLLCHRCNTVLGMAEESKELLNKMIDYIGIDYE